MSYQLKVKSQEAGPWGVNQSRYVTFQIQGGNTNWEIANSYIEFAGVVDMPTVTYAGGYSGALQFGYRGGVADDYQYSSGPSVFVKHAWIESSNLGKIESKRYANRINEHLASLQRSLATVESQDYSGGLQIQINDNEFICRLQLSDLFELAKDTPIVDLQYIGDVVMTLELEVVNANAVFLKYVDMLPALGIPMDTPIVAAPAGLDVLVLTNGIREETELHENQVYVITWDGSVTGPNQTGQHVILGFEYNAGNLEITIDPPLANVLEDVSDIQFHNLPYVFPDPLVADVTINTVDLVMYKPYGLVNMPRLSFREFLVDTDMIPATLEYHKQFTIEPNVNWCVFMNPKDDQFVNLGQDLSYYRNQVNGYDTVDRDVYLNSGLYYDRVIMNVPNISCVDLADTYHISEKMPENGQLNNLNLNLYYSNAPDAGSVYLFKHQLKQL